MQKRLFFLVICTSMLLAFINIQLGIPKSVWKKVDKEIAKLWPGSAVEKKLLHSSDCEVYSLYSNDNLEGYLLLSKAPSRYDYFDYMIVYDSKLEILHTNILVYRESYGGEIGSTRWLKQFIGYSNKNDFRLGYDIQGISGATISCQAATQGFKESTQLINRLKSNGNIE